MSSGFTLRSLAFSSLLLGVGCSDTGPAALEPPVSPETRQDLVNPTPVPQSVRFVWFVPTDVPFDSATVAAIERAAWNTRSWYRAWMDRSAANGADIVQEGDSGSAYPSWYILATGEGAYEIVAPFNVVPSQRVKGLDVGESGAMGAPLVQQDYVTAASQTWRFVEVE